MPLPIRIKYRRTRTNGDDKLEDTIPTDLLLLTANTSNTFNILTARFCSMHGKF